MKEIQKKLKEEIKQCKVNYKNKIEELFEGSSNDTRKAWQGIKMLTGFNKTSCLPEVEDNEKYANELNHFYSRFDVHDFKSERLALINTLMNMSGEKIIFAEAEVETVLEVK